MAIFPDANEKRGWRVKDTIHSAWRDLPGTHTAVEIWRMRLEGFFLVAIPSDETPPKEVG